MGTIPSETIEQIAAANDIVEVIGSYFPLKRAGTNFKALCPFHQEKTPSFTVSPSRQTFHCFGCGTGGSVFRFVMDYEHTDFPSAVRKLAARAGITVAEKSGRRGAGDEERQRELRQRLLKLHAEAAQWFHENLIKREIGEPARKYLKQRGITLEIANRWQLGYAPEEWDAFGSWARARGYDVRDLIASGLVKVKDESENPPDQSAAGIKPQRSYDRFRGRIIFPICNDVGEVIGFSGRLLQDQEGVAKYLNSPETAVFRKGSVLFGLDKTKRALIEADCAVVCEGQLDLISLFESGITNVVAPQGTAFTESQTRILKRFVSEVVLCFDADPAGQKAAERSLDALLQNDLIVRVAEMPVGEDPDSLVRKEGKEEFEKRLRGGRDFFDYLIEREAALSKPEGYLQRIRLARRIVEMIARVPDPLLRGKIVGKTAARLNLAADELTKLLPAIPTREIKLPVANRIPLRVPQVIEELCRLALRNPEFREFLLSQDWRRVLAEHEWGELLGAILEAQFDVTKPASIEAFLNSVDEIKRSFFSHLLTEKLSTEKAPGRKGWIKPKIDTMRVGKKSWASLQIDGLRRERKMAETLMAQPNLSTGDVINLQKQILDLQEQLHELSQPAGPADN
jgi:DNA primase